MPLQQFSKVLQVYKSKLWVVLTFGGNDLRRYFKRQSLENQVSSFKVSMSWCKLLHAWYQQPKNSYIGTSYSFLGEIGTPNFCPANYVECTFRKNMGKNCRKVAVQMPWKCFPILCLESLEKQHPNLHTHPSSFCKKSICTQFVHILLPGQKSSKFCMALKSALDMTQSRKSVRPFFLKKSFELASVTSLKNSFRLWPFVTKTVIYSVRRKELGSLLLS